MARYWNHLMSACAVWTIACTLAFPQSIAIRAVIVTNEAIDKATDAENRKMPVESLIQAYKSKGYRAFEVVGAVILASEDVYPAKTLAALSKTYKDLSSSIGPNGTVNIGQSTALQQLVQYAFGDLFRMSNPSKANYILNSSSNITVTDGTRKWTCPVGAYPDDDAKAYLEKAPLARSSAPSNTAAKTPSNGPIIPVAASKLIFTSYGYKAFDAFERASDVKTFANELDKLYSDSKKEIDGAKFALKNKLANRYGTVEGADLNGRASDLKEPFKSAVELYFTSDFEKFGFASKEEAIAFLGKLQVVSANTTFSIAGITTDALGQKALVQFGLP